jgi:hypothetical protein
MLEKRNMRSGDAQKAQDSDNDHNEAHEVNNAAHWIDLLMY